MEAANYHVLTHPFHVAPGALQVVNFTTLALFGIHVHLPAQTYIEAQMSDGSLRSFCAIFYYSVLIQVLSVFIVLMHILVV